jgi:hypothetical protein
MKSPFSLADKFLAKSPKEALSLAVTRDLPLRASIVSEIIDGGRLRAVKIFSPILKDHLYITFEPSFFSLDGLAVYFAEELPELRTKTPEQLREIHKVKLAFPGCRVIQEGAEARR